MSELERGKFSSASAAQFQHPDTLTAVVGGLSNTRLFARMERTNETHLSTVEGPSSSHARVSSKAQDPRWSSRAARASRQGASAPRGVSRRFGLPRRQRLRDEVAIAELLSGRVLGRGRWFLVRRSENRVGYSRLLLRVGKRPVRSAVSRNELRRSIRETFRVLKPVLAGGDYLVAVRAKPLCTDLLQARRELEQLFVLGNR
jgi:ribonuclease P protein component